MSEQQQQTRAEQDPYAEQRQTASMREQARVGVSSQHSEVEKRKMNPGFYREIADLHADTEQYNWIENEIGVKSAPGHILGNRSEDYVFQQQLLNKNWADRLKAERDRGRLWLKNPSADAVLLGLEGGSDGQKCVAETSDGGLKIVPGGHEDFIAPLAASGERRQYDDVAELQTTRESLAVQGEALGALTKASSEVLHRDEKAEETDTAGRISRLISR